jgi:hypothetical protein
MRRNLPWQRLGVSLDRAELWSPCKTQDFRTWGKGLQCSGTMRKASMIA